MWIALSQKTQDIDFPQEGFFLCVQKGDENQLTIKRFEDIISEYTCVKEVFTDETDFSAKSKAEKKRTWL